MLTGANAAYLVIPTFVAKLAGAAVIATKDARGRVGFPPRCSPFQCACLYRQIGTRVDLSSLDIFAPEPKRNHRRVDTSPSSTAASCNPQTLWSG